MKKTLASWWLETHCCVHQFLERNTLLLTRAYREHWKGKNFVSKFPGYCPCLLFLAFQIWGQNTIGGQYLQNINALIFWFNYLQKVNAMPSDFWWKKKVLPLWQITFDPSKNGLKKIFINGAKLVFFSPEIWGHCIYFLQVLISEYEGIYILQVLPSNCILPSDLKD